MQIQELKECRASREAISVLLERIECIRAAMEASTHSLRNGVGTGTGDVLASQMAKLDELQRQLNEKIIAYESRARAIEREIEMLPDSQRKIIRLRYISGLSWQTVALKANYDKHYCFKLHAKAIKKIEEDTQRYLHL